MANLMRTVSIIVACTLFVLSGADAVADSYPIVDTQQDQCYDTSQTIGCPDTDSPFFGQDAHYQGRASSYHDNGDGTVSDLNTGLMWQKTPAEKVTYAEAVAGADTCALAGYHDWRLPTIKELYSLMDFRGIDPSGWEGTDPSGLTPFIDTDFFDFEYGDTEIGDRIIDAQYWSSTEYVSTTMNNDATTFGVNFADGRIKGYPSEAVGPVGQQTTKASFVRFVRGNSMYGVNDYYDNGDGTVSDSATGLMWMQNDSDSGMTWPQALDYAEDLQYAGYDDWRLPNVKELQSIVDYTRSPATTNSAAIDPIFNTSTILDEGGDINYPFFWTGTTHINWSNYPGTYADYLAFGEALGFMEAPPGSGIYMLMDVHGAGAQRSDPKVGDPADWPYGHGPQGDVIRIYNYVRCVRDIDMSADSDGDGIGSDGDSSGTAGDNPCIGGNTENCDDNCPETYNPDQADSDNDGVGDVCEACCVGSRGNVDNDPEDIVSLGDLTALVDVLFISLSDPECWYEANVDASQPEGPGSISLGDLTALIDVLFISLDSPPACP